MVLCDCGNDEFVPMSMTDYPVMKCTNCGNSYKDFDISFEEYAEHFKPNRPKDWKVELINGKWVDTRPEQYSPNAPHSEPKDDKCRLSCEICPIANKCEVQSSEADAPSSSPKEKGSQGLEGEHE